MHQYWIVLILTGLSLLVSRTGAMAHADYYFSEPEVKERVETMPCVVRPKYDGVVKAYITGYLVRNRERTGNMIGRSVLYFPLFEKYLKAYGLPEGLKYLPVVESALNPKAISRAGAVGLWQFMEATGKSYGLIVDLTVDDRSDPVKSTIAAIEHLSDLYARFESWELALAAYNSGGGRVGRAMKRARSKDFWRIRRYLPSETRNYVPAFIAATYMMQYYHHHDLLPAYPDLDLQMTESIEVKQYISFARIAQITRLPLEVVEKLNPSFKRGYIPETAEGHTLVLPKRVLPALLDYLTYRELNGHSLDEEGWELPDEADYLPSAFYYFSSIYVVNEGDNLASLAELFNCSVHNLVAWNQLTDPELFPGQELVLYHPKQFVRYRSEALYELSLLPSREIKVCPRPPASCEKGGVPVIMQKGRFSYYCVQPGESVADIASKFTDVTIVDIQTLNQISALEELQPGALIKVRKN